MCVSRQMSSPDMPHCTQVVLADFDYHCPCREIFIRQHMNFLIEMGSFRPYCIKTVRFLNLGNDFYQKWGNKEGRLTPK